jgi:hypothetical protein
MEFHMGVVGDHARQAYAQTLETTTGIQVFGTPTDNILRMLQQQAGSGVPLSGLARKFVGGQAQAVGSLR